MAKVPTIGPCHICGEVKPLTDEHVPPRAAFNDKRTITINFDTAMTLGPDIEPKGKHNQGGVKFKTLCERCNNLTGRWYGEAFVDWCYRGADILQKTEGKPSLITVYHAFPLRVIKQIITMFFSVNSTKFREVHPYLEDFVLSKEKRYLPPQYHVYVYYNLAGLFRYHGVGAVGNFNGGVHSVFSEITYPPYGYVLSLKSLAPDKRLYEITHFARYGYMDFRDIEMRPPVLPTDSPLPGDYRTKEQMYEDRAKNELESALTQARPAPSEDEKARFREQLEAATAMMN
jgi:hypothetical protein